MILSRTEYIKECKRMLKELSWHDLRLAYAWIHAIYEREDADREERYNAEESSAGTPIADCKAYAE